MTVQSPEFGAGAAVAVRLDPRDPVVARHLLDHLVAAHGLDRLAADRAFQAQRETGEAVDVVLVELGLMSEGAMLAALSDYFAMPVASADLYPPAALHADLLAPDFLKRAGAVPVADAPGALTVVTSNPFAADTLAAIGYLTGRNVTALLARPKDVQAEIARLYGVPAERATGTAGADSGAQPAVAQEEDVQRLRDMASEAPVIRLVNRLIAGAVAQRASDIHIEPAADGLRVRYRIDGVMADVERLPLDQLSGVASRIKILARLNIAERRIPQDGRAKYVHDGREVDLRIATTPLMHGESVVLRILDRAAVQLDLAALGFDPPTEARLRAMLAEPNGILLVTGPTGSGKTTTLYAALQILNSAERKVFTVEDPIEYQLPGVNQMQIKPAIGLDFAQCLRSILRQDPDVVMIGEMRDFETARTAIQAALTGHLVLSTLHTNSAAASVTRLLDMGVEDYLLASTISGIMAQRLVRRLCRSCAEPDPAGFDALASLDAELMQFARGLTPQNVHRPVGCAECRNTGYKGRTTVSELLSIDDVVRARIVRGVSDRQLEEAARGRGLELLIENGLRKVAAGETTLAEVLRVGRTER